MSLLPLNLQEAIDSEICDHNTEQNESSNPSFHTPNPLLTSFSSYHPYMLPFSALDELVGAGNCQGMSDMQHG